MNRKRLAKIKREIAAARRKSCRAADLEGFAKHLGRKLRKGKKTGEPMWINQEFPSLYPLAIPHHGGKDLANATQRSILEQLEDDVLAWDERLEEEDDEEDEDGEGGPDAAG
jgi:predicted metal-dependent peptidase